GPRRERFGQTLTRSERLTIKVILDGGAVGQMRTHDLAHERLASAQVALHRASFLVEHDRAEDALRVVESGWGSGPRDGISGSGEPVDVGLKSFLHRVVGVLPLPGAERRELRRRPVVRPPPFYRLAGHGRGKISG